MTLQLAFDLPLRTAVSRADFFVSPANAAALQAIDAWRDWPLRRHLLIGPRGAGKTHLAHIWAAEVEALWLRPAELTLHLPDLHSGTPVVLDDADQVAGVAEAALFHLINLLSAEGRLLMTATSAPRDWGVTLPDLLSRLQATDIARLEPPDDDLLAAALAKLFADRQIPVPPNLIPYLLPRMERSIEAARQVVAALDGRSLATHRPVTRALAAEVLDTGGAE